jgi:hypothetical protein
MTRGRGRTLTSESTILSKTIPDIQIKAFLRPDGILARHSTKTTEPRVALFLLILFCWRRGELIGRDIQVFIEVADPVANFAADIALQVFGELFPRCNDLLRGLKNGYRWAWPFCPFKRTDPHPLQR